MIQPHADTPPAAPKAGEPASRKATLLRLLGSFLPQVHIFVPGLLATGLYTSMITLRVAAVYLILRVFAQDAPPPEELEKQGKRGQEVARVVRTFVQADANFSPILARINSFLDGVDATTGNAIRAILPRKVAENPKKLAQVASLATFIVYFLVLAFLVAAANYSDQYLKALLTVRVLVSMRIRLLKNLLYQPLAFYNDKQRGELISRMTNDLQSSTVCLNTLTGDMIREPLTIAWSVVLIGLIEPWLLWIVVGFVVVITASLRKQTRKVHRRARVRQQTTARVTEAMVQMFSGIRVVKAFGLENAKVEQYTQRNLEFSRDAIATDRAKAWTRTRMEFLTNMIMVVAVGVAMLVLGAGGNLPAGAMVLFISLMAQLYRPSKVLTHAYTDLHDHLPGAERMFEFMDLKPGLSDKPGATALKDVVGGVRFEDVSFAYNGNGRVLEHINLEIPSGQVVALVGPSGAGKSTLVNLVPRFYDPESGRITIDGTDIREFTRDSLLRNIAIVTQDPFLFNTSVRENIGHGRQGATFQEIVEAAIAANIHDFVQSLPHGYDTVVGERGANLSGGQCQRITIARAILRDARILILDEATSSLDSESERAVQQALQNLMKGRTTLVIAHRLSTVQHADKIVVLQDGRIGEVGTHDELLARPDSPYRRLYEMQFDNVPGPV
ncbi:MAG: ABC transporter ATP-binding protein [Planctomycetota bacterium]